MDGLVCEHVVTRTVRDSAAALDCTAGPDVGDPYWAPPPERPYLEEVSREPGRLRLAHWSRTFRNESIHPDCVAAVEKTARICADLGHQVEEAAPTVDLDSIDAIDLVVGLEEEIGLEISEDELREIEVVQDIVDLIHRALQGG